MGIDRRKFLGLMGLAGATAVTGTDAGAATKDFQGYPDSFGVLFDATRCIGCRTCEKACNEVNDLPQPEKPFDDLSVLEDDRRTGAASYTVVNKYQPATADGPVFRKLQCNHCLEPACASSCFVAAYSKTSSGAVVYDPSVCVGCRYCMIACPFYVPTYTYNDPLSPRIMKCTLCYPRLREGKLPGCVLACPNQALTFGKRRDVLQEARRRIQAHPERYIDHIYGEEEMGGTSWMYISGVPFGELGMQTDLGTTAAPKYTAGALEAVPVITALWPVLLGGVYAVSKRREKIAEAEKREAARAARDKAQEEAEAKLKEFKEKAEKDKQAAVDKAVEQARKEAAEQTKKEDS